MVELLLPPHIGHRLLRQRPTYGKLVAACFRTSFRWTSRCPLTGVDIAFSWLYKNLLFMAVVPGLREMRSRHVKNDDKARLNGGQNIDFGGHSSPKPRTFAE
eukprot:4412543-Pleurochrysis_carterae.AAC.1